MKAIAKVLLVGAVAAMAIAVSAAPSEAAKKMRMKPGSYVGQVCSTGGKVMVWGHDRKWYPGVVPVCTAPFCPAAC